MIDALCSLRKTSRTLRQSSTSCSSSSLPPCFLSAWLPSSSTTAGSSAKTDPPWVCVVSPACRCKRVSCFCSFCFFFKVLFVYLLSLVTSSLWWAFPGVFPLCPSPSPSMQRSDGLLGAVISPRFLIMSAQWCTLSLCVEQSGLSPGVGYSVMQRHKAQSSKQLSNRHWYAVQREKSHLVEQWEICATKARSFRGISLMPRWSEWAGVVSLNRLGLRKMCLFNFMCHLLLLLRVCHFRGRACSGVSSRHRQERVQSWPS